MFLQSLLFSGAVVKPKPFSLRALAYIKWTSPVTTMRICCWFFVACWSSQRPSVLYRHLGYQLLSSSLRHGILARAGSHNMRSFCLRESSSDLSLPHWLMSWQKAVRFSWYLLFSETSFSSWNWIHSLFSLPWAIKLLFFDIPWLVCCLWSEMFCCFRRGCWKTSWSTFKVGGGKKRMWGPKSRASGGRGVVGHCRQGFWGLWLHWGLQFW